MKDEYLDPVTFQDDNYQVNIYRPKLTKEELAKRQKELKEVTEYFMKKVIEEKEKREIG